MSYHGCRSIYTSTLQVNTRDTVQLYSPTFSVSRKSFLISGVFKFHQGVNIGCGLSSRNPSAGTSCTNGRSDGSNVTYPLSPAEGSLLPKRMSASICGSFNFSKYKRKLVASVARSLQHIQKAFKQNKASNALRGLSRIIHSVIHQQYIVKIFLQAYCIIVKHVHQFFLKTHSLKYAQLSHLALQH